MFISHSQPTGFVKISPTSCYKVSGMSKILNYPSKIHQFCNFLKKASTAQYSKTYKIGGFLTDNLRFLTFQTLCSNL